MKLIFGFLKQVQLYVSWMILEKVFNHAFMWPLVLLIIL